MVAYFRNKHSFKSKAFSSRPTQSVVVETVKASNGVLKVTFENDEQYKESLQTPPHRLAHIALKQGCSQMYLYIQGTAQMKTALLAPAVLREFRRLSAVG